MSAIHSIKYPGRAKNHTSFRAECGTILTALPHTGIREVRQ